MSFHVLDPGESQAHLQPQPNSHKGRLWLFVGAAVALVAAVGLVAVLATARSNKPVACSIAHCNATQWPKGAKNCSRAYCASCAAGYKVSQDSRGSYCSLDCPDELAYCARVKRLPRDVTSCESAACEECAAGAERLLDNQTLLPTEKCGFVCTQRQLDSGCAPGSCMDADSCSKCVPGYTMLGNDLRGANGIPCVAASSNTPMTFFMYRAQSETNYPPENANLASASGVMWYLHNEVVNVGCQCPLGVTQCNSKQRHYGISRVLRYRVTVYNTPEVYKVRSGQFGHFYTFDKGQCTNKDCSTAWETYGYTVGCQPLIPSQHNDYPAGAWYSLPGPCPSLPFSDRGKDACSQTQPGGHCDRPSGNATCTWHEELIDEIKVDDFCGISDYQEFCADDNVEYNQARDKGRGCSFWDDKNNATRNRERTLRLEQLFAEQTPGVHSYNYPDPVCDGF